MKTLNNLSMIKHQMALKLGLKGVNTNQEHTAIGWKHPNLENILLILSKGVEGPEVHFSDVSITEEWKEACGNQSIGLPLTGTRSVQDILSIFSHLFEVITQLGFTSVGTECRCEKRRRVYLLAAKRLGVQAQEMGENIFFTL